MRPETQWRPFRAGFDAHLGRRASPLAEQKGFVARRRSLAFASVLVLALTPLRAAGKLCGDDVQNRDVPCSCGDTVVSSLVLNGDPVARWPCPGDALIVDAKGAAAGVTIDLNGHRLRGRGKGNGLWLHYGGPGGARVISSQGTATIEGFRDGVVAHGDESVSLVDGVLVVRSARDGIRITGKQFEIRSVESRDAGRDGVSVNGGGFRLTQTRATGSGRFGYFIMGMDGTVGAPGAGNVAIRSGQAGFNVMGMHHQFVACEAAANGKDGMRLMGMQFALHGCRASNNGDDGISGTGSDWQLSDNAAIDNGGNGILVRGPLIEDGGGNRGSGNRGRHAGRPAVQCALGGRTCLP